MVKKIGYVTATVLSCAIWLLVFYLVWVATGRH
jgi:hypothetical protein